MRKLLLLPLALSTILAAGCAGIDPATVSSVDLQFSNPSSDCNVNLAQMITATEFKRTIDTLGTVLTITQTPGPTGVTSKVVKTVVTDATPGTEYALVSGGTTYVEVSEVTSLGTRVWRSTGGKLRVEANDAAKTNETLSNIRMEPYISTVAIGTFDLNGSIIVRF
ncbi:MAG TPA: hypothetical protein VK968_10285 [Roseimicrobium sp.]|nr:hypothetical protein [Roseimicrobium sp.]